IDLNTVNDDDWRLLHNQLVTPASSVCDERSVKCESVILFKEISEGNKEDCLDLESNDLNEFINTHSILLDDCSISEM
ncbi:hypothetical protein BY458DRAFT_424273, partial [Sporodiniella umbellata]